MQNISNWTYHYAFDDFTCDRCGHSSQIMYTTCPACHAKMENARSALRKIEKENSSAGGMRNKASST